MDTTDKLPSEAHRPLTANPKFFFGAAVVLAAVSVALVCLLGNTILPPVHRVSAVVLGGILRIVGTKATVNGTAVAVSFGQASRSLVVGYGCDGVLACLLLCSGILPFPCALRRRLLAVAGGVAWVFSVNQLRLLGLMGVQFALDDVESFEFYHVVLGQVFALVMIFLYWQWWASRTVRRALGEHQSESDEPAGEPEEE